MILLINRLQVREHSSRLKEQILSTNLNQTTLHWPKMSLCQLIPSLFTYLALPYRWRERYYVLTKYRLSAFNKSVQKYREIHAGLLISEVSKRGCSFITSYRLGVQGGKPKYDTFWWQGGGWGYAQSWYMTMDIIVYYNNISKQINGFWPQCNSILFSAKNRKHSETGAIVRIPMPDNGHNLVQLQEGDVEEHQLHADVAGHPHSKLYWLIPSITSLYLPRPAVEDTLSSSLPSSRARLL